MARLVIDLLYDAFKYRGLAPLDAQVVFDGRASDEPVYTSFTPHEIAQIATAFGYAVRILQPSDREVATATVMLRKGSVVGEVTLSERTEGSNLYASGLVGSPIVPPVAKRGARTALRRDQPGLRPDAWRIGVSLHFEGGVTASWVGRQIARGMKLVANTARVYGDRSLRVRFDQSAPISESDSYRSLLVEAPLGKWTSPPLGK